MSNTLEERLKTHSSAFDGLLSLIPAKYYYDDATQDQWSQKKKPEKEKKQNKRAKLDPSSKETADEYVNSFASAKDVMENKAKNAKKVVIPGSKPVKHAEAVNEEESNELTSASGDESDDSVDSEHNEEDEEQEATPNGKDNTKEDHNEDAEVTNSSDDSPSLIVENSQLIFDDDGNEIQLDDKYEGKQNQKQIQKVKEQAQPRGKKELSPDEQKKKSENLQKLREKLTAKIDSLREKRRAPGTKSVGAPKSREQILAERKHREELKRQEKLKRKRDELDDEDDEGENEADDDGFSSESDSDAEAKEKQVLFGNIQFKDGSMVTSDLERVRSGVEKKKQKGPANNDIKAHLLKLEQKRRKLQELSPEEKEKQREKEQWQKALAQAEGIKIKDDPKLLKKALKRKEKQKAKSEREWRERKQIVKDTIAAKQKRREENLKARSESKGKKGKKSPKLKKFTGTVNKSGSGKKRAGFEGTAKSKGKGKKKN
ncbi:Piso0_005361 [Millerozyma farinosa CBS 7064]|uniref:Piso0_005361 protein n=1 Tax=Pichia sorbitophila (strain ATCC MYA-4447 / BCRC 22081 / CBS 7064 / NBRC 10061 / NRRL Y-12695) TaxID=559304 RepID=G8Y1Z1_PICSO|nr:Piso0_005361 [Millerozyma farinosa CBS 7064]